MNKRLFNLVGGKWGSWLTIVVWIVAVALVNVLLPSVNSEKNDRASNLNNNQPSVEAQELIDEEFPSGSGTPALLTWHRDSGITEENLLSIQAFSKEITEHPVDYQLSAVPLHQMPVQALQQQLSENGKTFVQTVIFDSNADADELKSGLTQLEDMSKDDFPNNPFQVKMGNSEDLLVRVTGPVGIQVDATELFSQGDLKLLFATVALVLVFLLLIYRSPILAIIPLIAVGVAYGFIGPVLGSMSKAGWITFDSQAISIMTVLLFGAGTDYCLFLIARFRDYLKEEDDKRSALKRALAGSGGAIAMSGLTVVFSLLVLLLAKYGAVHRFAIPFSLSILIMMVASLTLVPAILSILGRMSFYPFVPRTMEMKRARAEKKGKPLPQPKEKHKVGRKIGSFVVKKPWLVTITSVVLLSVFAIFALKIQYTQDTLSAFPEDMASREGFQLIADDFSPGELAPVQVIVDSKGKEVSVKEGLESLDYVAKVSDPQQGKENSDLLLYSVELTSNPYSNEAMDVLPDLRENVEDSLQSDDVWIGGQTAEQYDTRETTNADAKIVIPVIIALIAVLLLAYLRSIVATVYLILTVLLSYFSALGLGWIVLHYGFGIEAISGLIPLYAFVFIVALGEDYNIFMVSSIWKKAGAMPLKDAVREGVAQTGSVITSAGLILAGTFLVLTTLPIQVLVQFGTVTAIGVLLDTFLVRPFLVPAITILFGKWAFWPGKVAQKREKEVM